MQSLKGHLLIASARLPDPNFGRTVVLMVQHGEEGALGLVLNRRLDATVRDVCRKVLETDCPIEANLYHGGPCDGPLMVVHTHGVGGEYEVLPGVHFTANRVVIEQILTDSDAEFLSKFFIGYSGWGAGQLESELETGSWLVIPAESDMLFGGEEKIWSRITTSLTAGIDRNRIPDDPSVN